MCRNVLAPLVAEQTGEEVVVAKVARLAEGRDVFRTDSS